MKKIYLFSLTILLTIFSFSSANLLTKNDPKYHFKNLGEVYLKYPIYADLNSNPEGFENYIHFSMDLKYESRIMDDFNLPGGWYRSTEINEVLFRDFALENGDLFTFGIKNYYSDYFYAQFIADFRVADTSYFTYENYSLFNLPSLINISLDFPTYSYLSYNKEDLSFLVGRVPLSYGPMKYNLVVSDNSPYYDTLTISYSFNDKLDYDFSVLSMVPLLSKEEYAAMDEEFIAFRNAFYNGLNYTPNEKLFLGISSLNQVVGDLPNPVNMFIKSDAGVYGGYIKIIPFWGINLDTEYAFNYATLSTGYGLGISKTFDFEGAKFKIGVERYEIQDNFFSSEYPYDNLYYRTIALSNEPGARIFFDYPFGFKYGEDSRINSVDLTLAFEKGYFSYIWDHGTNSKGMINSNIFRFLFDTKLGDFEVKWKTLKNGEEEFETFLISYGFEVNFLLP
ncbi:hypothetical protein [Petrotoga olearia]|uniref:DUF5723 domain-containing protein n=2 Tax=Petrotoga olearia TaxID=156203 RepID=A0A2K1P292_9BACT|nr:hypothetical protein [Petrotoga olearia]PNR96901.1 hypothetical protein X929_03955 [Petrotoga olearia DSM 13574]RMA76374.1 hypothetical protein C8D75_0015 [Petrotoga olearia]